MHDDAVARGFAVHQDACRAIHKALVQHVHVKVEVVPADRDLAEQSYVALLSAWRVCMHHDAVCHQTRCSGRALMMQRADHAVLTYSSISCMGHVGTYCNGFKSFGKRY